VESLQCSQGDLYRVDESALQERDTNWAVPIRCIASKVVAATSSDNFDKDKRFFIVFPNCSLGV
jgi:hypothetical protein